MSQFLFWLAGCCLGAGCTLGDKSGGGYVFIGIVLTFAAGVMEASKPDPEKKDDV